MNLFRKKRQSIFTLLSLNLFILLFVSACGTNASAFFQSGKNSQTASSYSIPRQNNANGTKSTSGTTSKKATPSNASIKLSLNANFPQYFSFGVMSNPGGTAILNQMRTSNGTSYAFRYQYLTGGVNTGHGWETWNKPAGEYATLYMNESAQSGYIPTFVYYELSLSNGSGGQAFHSSTMHQDSYNIGLSGTMRSYYANWALLMQRIGAFGKPTMVIVEPDLWAFLQNASHGTNNAASVPASVSSSGYPDAAGFPNNVQGFAWALLHMRDKYAPNAILAIHASTWAAGDDIATDKRTNVNVAGLVQSEASFLNSAGIKNNPAGVSTWDLISSDVADFDSAQPGGRSWWDPTNKSFPNFSRYLSFISGLSQATGRRVVMWQVPVGNQYFDTMNNTPGHYQDNRAQYILSNVSAFAAAGVVAVLFGPGNGGTTITDARHDGITNPSPIVSYQCNRCNNHRSSYSDDDGGFLRIFIGQYMQHPLALS